jgi:hypothetical protein
MAVLRLGSSGSSDIQRYSTMGELYEYQSCVCGEYDLTGKVGR